MSDIEIKYFNVENTSIRLIHIGGVTVPPNEIVQVVDDPEGYNRKSVDDSEYLEQTDKEPTWNLDNKEKEATIKANKSNNSNSSTATGAGWTKK